MRAVLYGLFEQLLRENCASEPQRIVQRVRRFPALNEQTDSAENGGSKIAAAFKVSKRGPNYLRTKFCASGDR